MLLFYMIFDLLAQKKPGVLKEKYQHSLKYTANVLTIKSWLQIGMYSFDCLLEKCIRTPGGILTKTDKGYALLCLGGGASVDCWEINDATAKPHKLTPTLKQNRSQCARRPHRPKPSAQTMKGQVVIRPSLVLNIIMRHCEPCWHGCRCFPLPSVFL